MSRFNGRFSDNHEVALTALDPRKNSEGHNSAGADDIWGDSLLIHQLKKEIDDVADTLATVLILGESGTGKELVARRVHHLSSRSNKPLIVVNCGGLADTLIETELFGHEKGSFTGAYQRKIGHFEAAHGGTLFLDEIGDMSLASQVKLLRALQEGDIKRVGGTPTSNIKVDVRIIAATHRDLQAKVAEGSFREDLYNRLNPYPIKTPPLREHLEDIPLLIEPTLKKVGARARLQYEVRFAPAALDTLCSWGYRWPGNFREFENKILWLAIKAKRTEGSSRKLLCGRCLGGAAQLRRTAAAALTPKWMRCGNISTSWGRSR